MTKAYFAAFQAGESAAIERMIDSMAAWAHSLPGRSAFATTPWKPQRQHLDWASAYGFRLTPALLATVETPTLVLWGGSSHARFRRANELLGECIPKASAVTVDDAALFMIATHASRSPTCSRSHVARMETGADRLPHSS